ncbi:MAG: sugar ABC transporter permease [Spirochaetaceae bacterium]|nr:MAG: sugar ABC transporter permease [Spirochaetaceae bacterium]
MAKNPTITAAGRRTFLQELAYNKLYYLMVLPGLAFLFVYEYIPMYGLVMAFQDFNPGLGFTRSPWIGFDNYRFVFRLPAVSRVFRNTIIISVAKIVFRQIAAITFAVLLNEMRVKLLKRSIQTISYLPHFLSWVILGGAFVSLLSRGGPVNQLIAAIGLDPIFFLGSNRWFRFTIVATDVWQSFGFGSIVYLAALTSIDPGLYESAVIDGANRFQQILRITLPGIATTIVLLTVLSLGQILSAGFEQILVLYNPAVYETGDVIDTWIYRFGLQQARYSLATAVGLFRSVIGCTLVLVSNGLARKYADYQVF